jgi:23S rRNA (uracil1939-C5)-methyltransferase
MIARPYPEQLELKHARVRRALARFPLLRRLPVEAVAPADPIVGYRSRTKLVAGPEGIGLYGGGGHTLVDLPGCRVLPEGVRAAVAAVRDALRAGRIAAHADDRAGLRGVDVRGNAAGDAVLLTLIVDDVPEARAAAEALGRSIVARGGGVAGAFVAPHAGETPRLLAPGAYHVAGARRIEDRVGETRYTAGAGAFVQAHRGQAERVHRLAAEHACGWRGARVLDLFAGGGGVGLALARAGARVTLVEAYAPAIADARESAARNGVEAEYIVADAEEAVDALRERRARFDAVVLNPPRRGCAPAVREGVAALGPERIVYVSCDPDTLARDLDHLRRLGYAAQRVAPLDMIPLTDEVETVALLARAPAPHPPVLYEDDALMVVDRWPDEPVAAAPRGRASTLQRVRGRRGWERAVALDPLDEGTSGACAFVRSPELADAFRRAGPPRVTYVALARGQTHASGTLRGPHGPSPARHTRLGVAGGQSLLRIEGEGLSPVDLRQRLAAIGHPVVGDARHGHVPTNRHVAERHTLTRQFLHAAAWERADPRNDNELRVAAPLAPDLELVLERLGGGELLTELTPR